MLLWGFLPEIIWEQSQCCHHVATTEYLFACCVFVFPELWFNHQMTSARLWSDLSAAVSVPLSSFLFFFKYVQRNRTVFHFLLLLLVDYIWFVAGENSGLFPHRLANETVGRWCMFLQMCFNTLIWPLTCIFFFFFPVNLSCLFKPLFCSHSSSEMERSVSWPGVSMATPPGTWRSRYLCVCVDLLFACCAILFGNVGYRWRHGYCWTSLFSLSNQNHPNLIN